MKVSDILVSQHAPIAASSPFPALEEAHGVKIEFHPFFVIEPVTSKEFRAQRINVLDYSAVVFTSKNTIDAYFHLCEELRIKVPDTMKYFCTTESVAKYLQKYIIYRKRKIFFGTGPASSLISEIGTKHASEKFLVTTSGPRGSEMTKAFDAAGLDYTPVMLVKHVSQDMHGLDLKKYGLIVMYNCSDVKSLYENFPDYEQGNTGFIAFGKAVATAMEDAGLKVAVAAPTPEVPSVSAAIEFYLNSLK